MNILFITLLDLENIKEHGIYHDLLREFVSQGNSVFVVSPAERRLHKKTKMINNENYHVLRVKTGNIQKTNWLEKGIATCLIEYQFLFAVKRYFDKVKFDMVMYSTPPITFGKIVEYIKKRDNSMTYLLLKDIFPQNAVDLGILSKRGVLYKYFRKKEKKLYKLSDYIGGMSQANVDFLLKNNDFIEKNRVEVCPNSVEIIKTEIDNHKIIENRKKFGLPTDKRIYIYGGNLGKPQGIEFFVKCLNSERENQDVYFLIVGSGTHYSVIDRYIRRGVQENIKLIPSLPKKEFDELVLSCDVGMIFLDYRFTIPNYPSRILSYMQAGLPVLVLSDENTDVGKMVEENRIGSWGKSDCIENFKRALVKIESMNIKREDVFQVLCENFDVKQSYNTIMRRFYENFGK